MQQDSGAGQLNDSPPFRYRAVIMVSLFHVAVLSLIFLYLDSPVFHATYKLDKTMDKSFMALCRIVGRPPGAILSILLLWRLKRRGWRWALALLVICAASAIFADALARVVCRIRPRSTGGLTVFMPYFSRFTDSGNRGASFASGDVMTAVALATVLAAAAPRARLVFFALAAGSAFWRLTKGAHFISDIYFSAVIGYYGATAMLILAHCSDTRRQAPSQSSQPSATVNQSY